MARRFKSSFDIAIEAVRVVMNPAAMMYELSFRGTPAETVGHLLRVMPYLIASPDGLERETIRRILHLSKHKFENGRWDRLREFLAESKPGLFVLAKSDWFAVQRVSSGRTSLRHLLETLIEFWGPACVYCGAGGVDLEIEHIVPVARGGNDALTNLTLACQPCNLRKRTLTAEEFGHPHIHEQAKRIQ